MSLPLEQQGLELKTLAVENARRSAAGDALAPLRGDSLSALEAASFPSRKTEQWKYTSLYPLTDGHLKTIASGTLPDALPTLAPHRLVMHNGKLQDAPSPLPEGVTLHRQARQRDELLTPFALYNGAALEDAITLEVAANTQVSAPVHLLLHAASDTPAHCQTRVEVRLNPGSTLTLIEHYIGQGPVLNNAVTVIEAGDNAHLTHYRLQSERDDTLHISTLLFRQTGASRIDSYQLMGGNRLRRNDVRALLENSGAELNMQGVFVARGQSHIDNQLCVEHRAPHCTSNQVYKGLAGEKGKAILNGRIHIHEGAKGTLAELSNKNLLLTPGAEIYTKPELEIYNDDVKCAHGATVGQLDAAQQFYLQSRGIALAEAKRMLSLGFVNELILALPDESVARWVQPWLAGELSQHPGANEEAA